MVDLEALVGAIVDDIDPEDREVAPRMIRVVAMDEPVGPPGTERVEMAPPYESLIGWVAPDRCQAVGVLAPGRAWYRTGGRSVGVADRIPGGTTVGPATVAVLVGRDGRAAARILRPGHPPITQVPDGGHLFDCLRRAVGLPTGPPPTDAAIHLQLALWLDGVRAGIERVGRPLSWAEILEQHPVGAAWSSPVPGVDVVDVFDLADATEWAAARTDWEDLRRRTASGPLADRLAPAGLADWMDAGMFARWVVDGLPDPFELVERIGPDLPGPMSDRLRQVIGLVW